MKEYTFQINRYRLNNRILIQIWKEKELYLPLTINIPEAEIKPDEFIFNSLYTTTCTEIHDKLEAEKFIIGTGKWIKNGRREYEIGKFLKSPDKLRSKILVL